MNMPIELEKLTTTEAESLLAKLKQKNPADKEAAAINAAAIIGVEMLIKDRSGHLERSKVAAFKEKQ